MSRSTFTGMGLWGGVENVSLSAAGENIFRSGRTAVRWDMKLKAANFTKDIRPRHG